MRKCNIIFSQDFLDDISEITRYIATASGSSATARKFYSDVLLAIEKRSFSAASYEIFHPYEGSPEYYRLYFWKYIIFYIVKDQVMDVRRMLWSGSDIPGRINNKT